MNIDQAPAAMIEGLARQYERALTVQDLGREELIEELSKAWATLHWERQNNRVMADTVPKLALAIQKANTQGKAADKTNRPYKDARKWVLDEWQRTKHLHLERGKPSKAAFVKHITEIRADIGTSLYKKETGLFPSQSTIEKRWLNGID